MAARGVTRRNQHNTQLGHEARHALNEARIALENARQALAYRTPVRNEFVDEAITLTATAQVTVQRALDAARKLSEA